MTRRFFRDVFILFHSQNDSAPGRAGEEALAPSATTPTAQTLAFKIGEPDIPPSINFSSMSMLRWVAEIYASNPLRHFLSRLGTHTGSPALAARTLIVGNSAVSSSYRSFSLDRLCESGSPSKRYRQLDRRRDTRPTRSV